MVISWRYIRDQDLATRICCKFGRFNTVNEVLARDGSNSGKITKFERLESHGTFATLLNRARYCRDEFEKIKLRRTRRWRSSLKSTVFRRTHCGKCIETSSTLLTEGDSKDMASSLQLNHYAELSRRGCQASIGRCSRSVLADGIGLGPKSVHGHLDKGSVANAGSTFQV
jgi:hypothetical protein